MTFGGCTYGERGVLLMTWEKSSLTLPNPERRELGEMIRRYALVLTYPAKKVYLEPGTVLDGVDYIAEGRTRHYMVAMDGTEKILYTLSAGWFFGETPCSLEQPHRTVFQDGGEDNDLSAFRCRPTTSCWMKTKRSGM